ncbi:hypothetical protein SD71_17225 [Cohnella kolymensis]|uniref:Uncharacterized protein n=1 Tax=Cohnella kolymensis TaxID=1590652 RepID=A0ABR5A2L5_9BACL|nr:hypothetical protein SD71_17225 [Cohnella kolymensis]
MLFAEPIKGRSLLYAQLIGASVTIVLISIRYIINSIGGFMEWHSAHTRLVNSPEHILREVIPAAIILTAVATTRMAGVIILMAAVSTLTAEGIILMAAVSTLTAAGIIHMAIIRMAAATAVGPERHGSLSKNAKKGSEFSFVPLFIPFRSAH